MEEVTHTDVVVIGAGISGIATIKCLGDAGLSTVALERTGEVGGLWTFRENDYGVMRFTHINVSKYNYCFSDYPFPEDVADYPHNTDMARYIVDYVKHFNLQENIKFHRKVLSVDRIGEEWQVRVKQVDHDGQTVLDSLPEEIYRSKFIAIATGHHAKPSLASFPGQESFRGEIIHSVKFKDALTNGMIGKRVLVVGIGNSAVDAAVNCATVGRCKSVYISTRSGAWVVPNYIFGHPTDLYACRLFFQLPFSLANIIFEKVICLVSGHPRRETFRIENLLDQYEPDLMKTAGTRGLIKRQEKIDGSKVIFMNGESAEFDHIILCTGYKIDLPFLSNSIRQAVLNEEKNEIKLYKNVFSPEIGQSLAFIGFVQPASGGVLTMSEIQARWFAEMCKGRVKLPSKSEMEESVETEKRVCQEKYYRSARHTIQRDPIVYNDEIADKIGAKPSIWKHPDLAWRLLLGSCGAYQWRLQGPDTWKGAKGAVRKVPVTELMQYSGILVLVGLAVILFYMYTLFSSLF